MTRARDIANLLSSGVTFIDKINFDGIESRWLPKSNGEAVKISNSQNFLISVNGTVQTVDSPEYVWQSPLPRQGFYVDSENYFSFSEVPPAGSTFSGKIMTGPNNNSFSKNYPFNAEDILLGA